MERESIMSILLLFVGIAAVLWLFVIIVALLQMAYSRGINDGIQWQRERSTQKIGRL